MSKKVATSPLAREIKQAQENLQKRPDWLRGRYECGTGRKKDISSKRPAKKSAYFG